MRSFPLLRLAVSLSFLLFSLSSLRAAPDPLAQLRSGHPRPLLTEAKITLSADARLAILLTPVGDHWPASLPAPVLTPLTTW